MPVVPSHCLLASTGQASRLLWVGKARPVASFASIANSIRHDLTVAWVLMDASIICKSAMNGSGTALISGGGLE